MQVVSARVQSRCGVKWLTPVVFLSPCACQRPRSLKSPACFAGFWIDLSALNIQANTPYALSIKLPAMAPGAFGGVYYDNVDTVYAQVA